MASITEQIVSLATALGATASGNYTISSAIDLLADTLAGSDQSQQATIAAALGELSGKISKVPSGTISITENGTGIDVSSYATADVSVSGGASTVVDVYMFNMSTGDNGDMVPSAVSYLSGYDRRGDDVLTQLTIESITASVGGTTRHGVKVSDVPAGAWLRPTWGTTPDYTNTGYCSYDSGDESYAEPYTSVEGASFALAPIDGDYVPAVLYGITESV